MKVNSGTTYHDDTPMQVVDILERERTNYDRLKLYFGDATTGKDWEEVYDTTGYIGRSGGRIQVPLLLHNRNSVGGGAISTHCIVRIGYANKKNGTHDLYRHPLYHHS